jgi:hypothetical protein
MFGLDYLTELEKYPMEQVQRMLERDRYKKMI